jgi:hypothetical protein
MTWTIQKIIKAKLRIRGGKVVHVDVSYPLGGEEE